MRGRFKIAKPCPRCGAQCESTFAAWTHCVKPWPRGIRCRRCGAVCETARDAYVHCQRAGMQRTAGFHWHGGRVETLEKRKAEVRADDAVMGAVRELAGALVAGEFG